MKYNCPVIIINIASLVLAQIWIVSGCIHPTTKLRLTGKFPVRRQKDDHLTSPLTKNKSNDVFTGMQRHASITNSHSENEEIKSFITITESKAKCKVTIIGCLHGSTSSALDVTNVLSTCPPDIIVLELCPSRFKSILKQLKQEQPPTIVPFFQMIQQTYQTSGFTTAIATTALGITSGIQSGFISKENHRPGIEFQTAIDYAQNIQNDSLNDNSSLGIILADRDVNETLERVGKAPLEWMKQLLSSNLFQNNEKIRNQTRVLAGALMGKDYNMFRVLTRNEMVKQDFIRLNMPTLFFMGLSSILIFEDSKFSSSFQSFPEDLNTWLLHVTSSLFFFDVPFSMITLGITYILLVLPLVQVIIEERDDYLFRGICSACEIVSKSKDGKEKHQQQHVVAIVGMLHVNGVLKRLMYDMDDD